MSNSVEIFQNTLLKLVVRSGSDSDRKNIVLDVGEIGYTTDTKRLYVGDGVTLGGVLAGNVIIGQAADFSTITTTPLAAGDLVYVTGSSTLYRYVSGSQTLPTSWSAVGRIYSPENTTLVFTGSGNLVKVGTLSAGNFSNDAVAGSIYIDGSGRIALSAVQRLDAIQPLSNTFVSLPSSLKIGLSTYNFPITGSQPSNSFLRSDGSGNLTWTSAATLLTAASATLIPGKGVALSVGGTQTTRALLLTSGDVQIDAVFSPTHAVEFKQNGTITRNVGVVSVENKTYADLIGSSNVPAGSIIDRTDASLVDNNGARVLLNQPPTTGAWKITLSTAIDTVSSVVDVSIKNATVYYTPITTSDISTELSYRYFLASPTELWVYTYAPRKRLQGDKGQNISWAPPILTPGQSDESTRFCVTVCGA